MKIVVTGGAGFLGSHVADALSSAGHDVLVFDTKASPWLRPDQQMLVGDILDETLVPELVRDADAIYHFAAVADINEAQVDPVRTIEVNVLGTLKLLEAARTEGVKRFVFASSIYVYSHQGGFYRTSKQSCEKLIEDYQDLFGLPFTILRFGSLYGPRAGVTNAIHCMVSQAIDAQKIQYFGNGKEVREYIHVFDGAAAAVDVLNPEYENQIIHLTGHERMTTGDMMEMISEILGGGIDIEVNIGERTGHYVHTPYSYTPKLGKKFIRETYIDIGLGLLDLIEHHRQYGVEGNGN